VEIASAAPAPASSAPVRASGEASSGRWNLFKGARQFTVEASSEYPGWPASNLVDQDPATSWFSASNDSVARGTSPWVQVAWGRPETVRQVFLQGNRDPAYPRGFSVITVRLALLDARGEVAFQREISSPHPPHDFELVPPRGLAPTSALRVEILQDEGGKNSYGDVALGELTLSFEEEK
jgi:hypothetical protein